MYPTSSASSSWTLSTCPHKYCRQCRRGVASYPQSLPRPNHTELVLTWLDANLNSTIQRLEDLRIEDGLTKPIYPPDHLSERPMGFREYSGNIFLSR